MFALLLGILDDTGYMGEARHIAAAGAVAHQRLPRLVGPFVQTDVA